MPALGEWARIWAPAMSRCWSGHTADYPIPKVKTFEESACLHPWPSPADLSESEMGRSPICAFPELASNPTVSPTADLSAGLVVVRAIRADPHWDHLWWHNMPNGYSLTLRTNHTHTSVPGYLWEFSDWTWAFPRWQKTRLLPSTGRPLPRIIIEVKPNTHQFNNSCHQNCGFTRCWKSFWIWLVQISWCKYPEYKYPWCKYP